MAEDRGDRAVRPAIDLQGWRIMALSEFDRCLLQACLQRKPGGWEGLVDRFLGVVIHALNHATQSDSMYLDLQDREDLTSDVFLTLLNDDFAVLRRFRGDSSLATYLAVIARRVILHELAKRKFVWRGKDTAVRGGPPDRRTPAVEERVSNRDEIRQLLGTLQQTDADIVRMYYLEGKSYHQISLSIGIPENSIGPMLSRARARMRRQSGTQVTRR